MLFLIALAAAAPPPPADAAALFSSMAARGHVQPRPQAPLQRGMSGPGASLLDVYRYGDLAILRDDDGEWLTQAIEKVAANNFDWVTSSMYDAFYLNFEDEYDYLCVLLVQDFGLFFAFYQPLSNDVEGIGYDRYGLELFDYTTDTQVEGFIFMNYVGLWSENPASGRYVFGQEFMHRWGSFVNVSLAETDTNALLGRDSAHWSYFFHTPNSPMEGNTWVDQGDGTWRTDYLSESTYSNLDLYLMGLVGPEEVEEQTLLLVDEAEASAIGVTEASTPQYFACVQGGPAYCGDPVFNATPVYFGIDDIIAAEGPRVPAAEDSQRSFRMAFLVLGLQADVLDAETLNNVDAVRQAFETGWEADVRGLADLNTTLGAGTAPAWLGPEDTGAPLSVEDTGGESAKTGGCGCNTGVGLGPWALLPLGLVARRRRAR